MMAETSEILPDSEHLLCLAASLWMAIASAFTLGLLFVPFRWFIHEAFKHPGTGSYWFNWTGTVQGQGSPGGSCCASGIESHWGYLLLPALIPFNTCLASELSSGLTSLRNVPWPSRPGPFSLFHTVIYFFPSEFISFIFICVVISTSVSFSRQFSHL